MSFDGNIDFGSSINVTPPKGQGDVLSPLLVGLYDTHRSYAQKDLRDFSFKEKLCEQMTALLSVSSRVSDTEMITDILVSLIKQSERDLKAALSERMSTLSNVPLRLLLQLVNDDIDVAKPVLENSPVFNDLDLLYIIQSRDTSFWQAIAARRALHENVVDALAETRDIPTAKVLVHNDTISFSDYAVSVLGELAVSDDSLAEPLLMRPDVPQEIARKLYSYVGEEIKSMIAKRYQISSPEIIEAIEDVVSEFTDFPVVGGVFLPTSAMVRAAEMFQHQGKLTPTLMVKTLKRGQLASFLAQFSVYVGLPVAVVVPMLRQNNGQGLAIAARAHGLSKDEFMSIFMLTRKMVNEQGVVNAAYVNRAVNYFDRISPHLAKKILKRSQH